MRSPSSSAGSPSTGTSRTRRRSQPASNQPYASAATASASRIQGKVRPGAPQSDRAWNRPSAYRDATAARTLRVRSDGELLDERCDRDHVPLELELRLLEACGDPDQLREVQDRHLEVLAGCRLQLRLPGVEGEVAERARCHHRIRTGLLRLLDRLDQLAERGLLARLDDREATALDLGRVVDR